MIILKYIKNFIDSKTIRRILVRTSKSTAVKLFFMGFVIIFTFSMAIFYIEKNYIVYKTENGVQVEDGDNSSNIRSFEDSVWWAFVTSTTVGYGDYFPKSQVGRVLGILLMFFGISLVGVITGNIASFLVEKQLKEDRGLKDLKLKNHFIICGWKRNMGEVLRSVMGKNKSFLASEIVLINTAPPEDIENLKSEKEFAHINFIHGDYIDERVLNRANLKKAKKVLVLADRLVTGSVQEVDSRTVMSIITIKSMTKSAYTCAELLDSKFERYLSTSNCDEIILSTDYNRSLIANASAGSGISHVISELLNVEADVSIDTQDLPKKYIGLTYEELFNYYLDKNRSVLIGVLENTGNFYERKKEAIKEAQKTPDISTLVDNLKVVKELVANQPVINPAPSYILKKYSKAIIIEGRAYNRKV
ncbi:MAG: transporter [bacterium]|nr:transporter [bacterium]